MNFLEYLSATRLKKCGTYLKSHMREPQMWRELESMIQEYELFRMQQEETIVDVQKRFTHIVNHLIGLEKKFDKEELKIKILKCLDRSW